MSAPSHNIEKASGPAAGPASKGSTIAAIAGLTLILLAAGFFWWRSKNGPPESASVVSAVEQHYKRGLKLEESGNNKGAEESFLTAIALDPGFARAHFALADLYDSAGRPALAAEKLKALLAANPNTPHVQCRRAELYLKADGFEKVIRTARSELARDPKCPLGNTVMGMALILAGDNEGAIAHLKTAHAAAPQDERVTRTLAQVLGQAGRPNEGLEVIKPLILGDDTSPDVEYLAGWLQMQSGFADRTARQEALKLLTRAVSLASDFPAANGALGTLLVRMGMPADGLKFLDKAQKAGVADLDMARAMAKATAELKRPDAPKWASFANETAGFNAKLRTLRLEWLQHPDNVKNTLALAEMEIRRRDTPDARDLIIGVLKNDPNQPEGLRLLEGMVGKK